MVGKPTELGRWATVSGTQIVVPVEGKKDKGFVPDEEPSAQAFNWKWNTDYKWKNWLDGIAAPGSGEDLVYIDSAGVIAAGPTELTIPTTHYHGERKLWIHAGSFTGIGGAFADPSGSGAEFTVHQYLTLSTSGQSSIGSIPLLEGDRIVSIKLSFYTTTASSWTIYTNSMTTAGTNTPLDTDNWTTGAGGYQTREVTLGITCAVDTMYYIRVANGSIGRIVGMQIIYDRVP